jgi:hypothetical protein
MQRGLHGKLENGGQATRLFLLKDVHVSQRPLHVQGDASHPG